MDDRKTTPENIPYPSARAPSRRWLFRAIAILAGLLPFALLEGSLRIFDVGRPANAPDPYAGFNKNFPLFERHGDVYRTSYSRAPFIQTQEFPAEKPRNGYRIFCFGGSTIYGHPYLADTALPKWLELELAARDPAHAYQAVNCGGVSYASYRIMPMVKEVLAYQPDLIVVATGENEFLEDRTYHSLKQRSAFAAWLQVRLNSLHTVALARKVFRRGKPATSAAADGDGQLNPAINTRLDYDSGYASYHRDEAWHQNVFAQYDESVRTIVADCQAAHVPLLLIRLGGNLRDCPPYKSEHRTGLTPEAEGDWQAAFDIASAAEKSDPARALQFYHNAEKIDDQYALLDYRVARLLDRTGRRSEALTYYQKALDDDICPLRLLTPVAQILGRIATETHTPLVQAGDIIAARSPEGIPGDDWYLDHVHPTIGGTQLIAHAVATQMKESGWVKLADWPEKDRIATYGRHIHTLSEAYFADGERRVGWLEKWAQRKRLAQETAPNDAAGFARLAFRRLDLREDSAAWDAVREALRRDPTVADLIRRHAQDLQAQGRGDRAEALLNHLK